MNNELVGLEENFRTWTTEKLLKAATSKRKRYHYLHLIFILHEIDGRNISEENKNLLKQYKDEASRIHLRLKDDKPVMAWGYKDSLLLTKRRIIIFKTKKPPVIFDLSNVCSVFLRDLRLSINGEEVYLAGGKSLVEMLREAVFPLWETPRDGGISDINYREIVVEVEANKKYQKHVDSFRKEWKKASRADIILGLLSLLDKISRKAGPTQPLLVERAELWKSVINLACAENLRIVLYVTQKSAITSPRGYGGELSWHRSAQNAMDSASLAWLNTDSIGSEVVRQIIQRARAQLQVSIDEARSDPRFKEVDETAYGSGLPFDTAYYTPADLIAIRDKLTLENIKTCLTSIVGHERISNWIPD